MIKGVNSQKIKEKTGKNIENFRHIYITRDSKKWPNCWVSLKRAYRNIERDITEGLVLWKNKIIQIAEIFNKINPKYWSLKTV